MVLEIRRSSAGFTLVEALVAAILVATAAVVLAQLVALGATQSAHNRGALEALVVAQSKLEQLRAATWSTSVVSADLTPGGSLVSDAPGYADRPPMFVRRWTVRLRDPADATVVVLTVCVFLATQIDAAPEACVSTIRTRRP